MPWSVGAREQRVGVVIIGDSFALRIESEGTAHAYGDIRQTEIHVQRWRDGKIYDESIYLMPLNKEQLSDVRK